VLSRFYIVLGVRFRRRRSGRRKRSETEESAVSEEEEAEEEKGAKLKNLLFLAVFLAFLFVVLHVGSFLITPAATTDSADASAER